MAFKPTGFPATPAFCLENVAKVLRPIPAVFSFSMAIIDPGGYRDFRRRALLAVAESEDKHAHLAGDFSSQILLSEGRGSART